MEFPTWEDVHEKQYKNAKAIKLRMIRLTTELSQKKFAEKFNIPCRTIENWEEGITEPPDYVLELLRKVVVANNIIKMMEKDTDETPQAHEEYLQAITSVVKVKRWEDDNGNGVDSSKSTQRRNGVERIQVQKVR